MFLYKFLNVCPFDYTAIAGSEKVALVNHTNWVAVVTPTNCPKSVRNRCVIELFCGVVCVGTLSFYYFCWCREFCHRTESDLFLFLIAIVFWSYKKSLLEFQLLDERQNRGTEGCSKCKVHQHDTFRKEWYQYKNKCSSLMGQDRVSKCRRL